MERTLKRYFIQSKNEIVLLYSVHAIATSYVPYCLRCKSSGVGIRCQSNNILLLVACSAVVTLSANIVLSDTILVDRKAFHDLLLHDWLFKDCVVAQGRDGDFHDVVARAVFADGELVGLPAEKSDGGGAGNDPAGRPTRRASGNDGGVGHVRVVAHVAVRVLHFEVGAAPAPLAAPVRGGVHDVHPLVVVGVRLHRVRLVHAQQVLGFDDPFGELDTCPSLFRLQDFVVLRDSFTVLRNEKEPKHK